MLVHTCGIGVCGKERAPLLLRPRLHGGPDSIVLSDSDGDYDSYNGGVYPCGEDRTHDRQGSPGLRRNMDLDVREEEEGHVDDGIQAGQQVQNSGVEEQN